MADDVNSTRGAAARGESGKTIPSWATRAAAIVGAAALWPSLFNQLLYPVTFTFYSTHDYTSYSFSFVYSFLVILIAALLAGIHRKSDSLLLNNGKLIAAFGVLGSVGIVLVSQCNFSNVGNMVGIGIGVALVAIYVPTHFLFWSLYFAQSERRDFLVDMALSFALFAAVSGLRLTLGIHSTEISIACPLISTGCALFVAFHGPRASRCTGSLALKDLPWNFLVPCLIFLVIATVSTIIFRGEMDESAQPTGRNLAHLVLALTMVALALIYRPREKGQKGSTLHAFVLVSLVFIGCVLASFLMARELMSDGSVPFIVGNGMLHGFMWMLIIRDANRRHASPTSVAALFLAVAIVLPRMLRAIAVYQTILLPRTGDSLDLFLVVGVTAFASAAILVVALLRFFTTTELAPELTDSEKEEAEAQAFARLADALELTEREVEVAKAINAYPNAEEISKALFIAESTVRTHIKRIYRKTGVHSKAEFAALVEEYRKR